MVDQHAGDLAARRARPALQRLAVLARAGSRPRGRRRCGPTAAARVTGRVPRYAATSTPCAASASLPALEVEHLVPAVEPRAGAPRRLDHVGEPAIAAREHALDERDAAVVMLEPQARARARRAARRIACLRRISSLGILRAPLQRRVRLGHVRADADRDLGATARRAPRPMREHALRRSRRCRGRRRPPRSAGRS